MKVTESKIKQMIYEVLIQEVAKGPRDLPDYAYVRVFVRGKDGRKGVRLITVMLTNKDGEMLPPVDIYSGKDNPVWGDVSFYEKNPSSMPCDDAAIIAVTQAADGWGPFLYDIAMEIATMNSNGLAPDRLVVSDEAQKVWDFYSKNRPDVQEFQMDDEYNSLTPERDDNCGQFMSRDTTSLVNWDTSPLSRRYKKEAIILNQIRDKLIWEL